MKPIDIEKIEEVVAPIAQSVGVELVACDWTLEQRMKILRVYIDKPQGVKVIDCERLSHLLGPVLDVEDLIPENYHLEISSPGLERPLRKLSDFIKFKDSLVRLRTHHPIQNRGHFKGRLKGVEDQEVLVEIDKQIYRIPHLEIRRANLEVDWDKESKSNRKSK